MKINIIISFFCIIILAGCAFFTKDKQLDKKEARPAYQKETPEKGYDQKHESKELFPKFKRDEQKYGNKGFIPKDYKKENEPKGTTKPPGSIQIKIYIQNWNVYDHKIISYKYEWGKFRFAGKYLYFNDIVFKFKSNKFNDYFWMGIIPSARKGVYEIPALLYEEPSRDLKPTIPPNKFFIKVKIKNSQIVKHIIINPHPGWGEFYVTGLKNGVLTIENLFYENQSWVVLLPVEDGEYTLRAILNN